MAASQKVKIGDTVEVLWEDTFTMNGWRDTDTVRREMGPCIVRNVGVLIDGDSDFLCVASSVGPGIVGEATRIPMSSVLSAVRLLCEEAHTPVEGVPETYQGGIPSTSPVVKVAPKKGARGKTKIA